VQSDFLHHDVRFGKRDAAELGRSVDGKNHRSRLFI
jgi:hypothetical protein